MAWREPRKLRQRDHIFEPPKRLDLRRSHGPQTPVPRVDSPRPYGRLNPASRSPELARKNRRQREHDPSLEKDLRLTRNTGDPRDQPAARREHASQASFPRFDARQSDAARRSLKKGMKPAKQRVLAGELQEEYGASQRRICKTMRFNRKSMQYKPKVSAINSLACAYKRNIASARALRVPSHSRLAETSAPDVQSQANRASLYERRPQFTCKGPKTPTQVRCYARAHRKTA